MPETGPVPHARISLDIIYGELVALRASVAAMGVEATKEDVRDHETRIRALERKAWVMAGLGGALGISGSWVAGLIGS